MKIAISGSSGFVGSALTRLFRERGDEVASLSHSSSDDEWLRALTGCRVVINLAGATINHRWTKKYKALILNSRVETTRRLIGLLERLDAKPELLISASAVGIYPSEGEYTDESSETGSGFLAQVCRQWEAEACRVSPDIRLVISRFGVVLDRYQGALPLMLLPFRFFAGGPVAGGDHFFSWIHLEDLKRAFLFVIDRGELSGPVNFTSPEPVTNARFAATAASVLRRPDWLPLPSFLFRLLYGEGAVLMTEGQRVFPTRLEKAGFTFLYPALQQALQSLEQEKRTS